MSVKELASQHCPECDAKGMGQSDDLTTKFTCPTCHGTGRKFWQLWRECPGMSDEWEEADYDVDTGAEPPASTYVNIGPVRVNKDTPCTKDGNCLQCGGSGYVLKPEAECEVALLDYCQQQGWFVQIIPLDSSFRSKLKLSLNGTCHSWGDVRLDALAQAIMEAQG